MTTLMNRISSFRGTTIRRVPDAAEGVTLWRRVADEIEQAIAAGTYLPGTRLPGELDIASRLGVNRHTVRRAIAALSERGLVRAERGSGTFIEARRISYPIRARTRFSENLSAMPIEFRSASAHRGCRLGASPMPRGSMHPPIPSQKC
jgi:DNA-binding GntR family transcriptional regulator